MKKTHLLLKAALSVALCIPPWGGLCEWLTPQAKAQSEAFPLGDRWADMFQPGATLTIAELQNVNAPLRYDGSPAERAQMVRTDEEGQVLFFAVDGNLYDGEGFLIADAKADGCTECLEIGVMEMLAVPAPGQCDKYFLFSMNGATSSGADLGVQIAILDLAGENPHWPGHRGRLLNLAADEQHDYPAWLNWTISA